MSAAENGFYTFEPVTKAFLRTLLPPPPLKENSWGGERKLNRKRSDTQRMLPRLALTF